MLGDMIKIKQRNDPDMDSNGSMIFTIGYEGLTLDEFVRILKDNGIEILIDVRNNPFSRKPGFSRKTLSEMLSIQGIGYIHIPELGIPSEIRKSTPPSEEGRLLDDYERDLPWKMDRIQKIIEMGREKRIALMCFEKDVRHCHRGRIGTFLNNKGFEVVEVIAY
jgi:uncharacterized protein (DUF488 family)